MLHSIKYGFKTSKYYSAGRESRPKKITKNLILPARNYYIEKIGKLIFTKEHLQPATGITGNIQNGFLHLMAKRKFWNTFTVALSALILSGCAEVKTLPPFDKNAEEEECAVLVIPADAAVKRVDGAGRKRGI